MSRDKTRTEKKLLQFLEIADNTQVTRTLGGNSQGLTVTRVSSCRNGFCPKKVLTAKHL